MRSSFFSKLLNELKVQYVYSRNAIEPNPQLPGSNIPRAIVTVRSALPDGRTGQTDVQFRGQRFTPEYLLTAVLFLAAMLEQSPELWWRPFNI